MALLHHRPRIDTTNTEFQALVRVFMANDSGCLLERMICLLPVEDLPMHESVEFDDQFCANIWDVQPLCQVIGVCHDNTLVVDGCRGVSIRWKNFPRIDYIVRTRKSFRAMTTMWLGPILFSLGLIILSISLKVGTIISVIGLLMVLAAPWSVQSVYSAKVWGQAPWLIGFESTLPLETIEQLTFGKVTSRFVYAHFSSVLCRIDEYECIGRPPHTQGKLPNGHRIFTLVDTGTMTVTVFSAKRPPSVALICGKEGGMLRVVLCSYHRETNCLHKETVLRMETSMLDQTTLLGWIKLR